MRKNRELAKKLESSEEEEASSGSEENSVHRMVTKIQKTQNLRKMKERNFKHPKSKEYAVPHKRVYLLNPEESKKNSASGSDNMPKQQDIGTMELKILTNREIASRNRIMKVEREISQVGSLSDEMNSQSNVSSPELLTIMPTKRTSFDRRNKPAIEISMDSNKAPSYQPIKIRDDLSMQKGLQSREVSYVKENADVIFRKPDLKQNTFVSSPMNKPYAEQTERHYQEPNSVNEIKQHHPDSEYSTPMASERRKQHKSTDKQQVMNTAKRGSNAHEWIHLHRPSLKQQLEQLEDPSRVEISGNLSGFRSSKHQGEYSPEVFENPSGHQSEDTSRSFRRPKRYPSHDSSGSGRGEFSQTIHTNHVQLAPLQTKQRDPKVYNTLSASRTFDKITGSISALEDISQWRANVERDKQGFFQRIAVRIGVPKQREREEKARLLREQEKEKHKQQKKLKWAGFADDEEMSAGPRREMKGEAAKGSHFCNNCKYCTQLQKSTLSKSAFLGEDFQNEEYDEWTKTEQFLLENFGDYGYIFVLRALFPLSNYSRGCAVAVPETIVFKDGISKVHLSYSSDETKIIRPKEPYTSTTIRKIFVDKDYQTQKNLAVESQSQAAVGTNSKVAPGMQLSMASVATPISPTGQGSKVINNLTEMLEMKTTTEVKPNTSEVKGQQPIQDDFNNAEKDIAAILRPFCVILSSPDLVPRNVTYPEFTKITELRKTHRFWSELRLIQSCKTNKHAVLSVTRVRFDSDTVDAELLLRAEKDVFIREGRVPVFAKAYVSPDEETRLLGELKALSKVVYCRYLCCKLFAYVSHVNRIQLNKFIAEFYEDEQGAFWFCNVRIIQVVFQDLEESIQHINPKKQDAERAAQADSNEKAAPNIEEIQQKELALKRKEEQKRQLLLEMELIMESRHKSLFSFKKNISKLLPFVTPNFELDKNKKLGNIFGEDSSVVLKSQHNKSMSKHSRMEPTEDSREPSIVVLPAVDSVSQSSAIGSAGITSEKGLIHSGVMHDEIIEQRSFPKIPTEPGNPSSDKIFGKITHPVHMTMRKIGAIQLPDERKPAYYQKVLERREHARTRSVPAALRGRAATPTPLLASSGFISLEPAKLELHEQALDITLLRDPRVRRAHGLDGRLPTRASSVQKSVTSKLPKRQRFPQASEADYYLDVSAAH